MGELMRVDGQQLDADLSRIADAIRSATGTAESLTFPQGFAAALENLNSSAGEDWMSRYLSNQLGDYVNTEATKVPDYAFYGCTGMTSVRMEALTSTSYNTFQKCTGLTTAVLPNCSVCSNSAFNGCSALTQVEVPKVAQVSSRGFYQCTALKRIDLNNCSYIQSSAFNGCTVLETVILRRGYVCTLAAADVFTGTPIAAGTGFIYVPGALVENYKTATNWSAHANQIRAIEDYPEITGGAGS